MQDIQFNILNDGIEEYKIVKGSRPSSLESKPIWDALKESELNLQQAISIGSDEEITEANRRIDWIREKYFNI